VEAKPKSLRLRKRILDATAWKRATVAAAQLADKPLVVRLNIARQFPSSPAISFARRCLESTAFNQALFCVLLRNLGNFALVTR